MYMVIVAVYSLSVAGNNSIHVTMPVVEWRGFPFFLLFDAESPGPSLFDPLPKAASVFFIGNLVVTASFLFPLLVVPLPHSSPTLPSSLLDGFFFLFFFSRLVVPS